MGDSDFIIRLYKTYQDKTHVFLLLEPCVGGELLDICNDRGLYGKTEMARFFLACVTMGLEHMHSKRVIYRDLKLENCLLDATGYVKLTDFGLAKMLLGKTYTVCGTADYFAPETLKQSGHNRAVDWWAMGVLAFIMLAGVSPFDAPDVMQVYKNIVRGFSKVTFPDAIPPEFMYLIKSLCRKCPEERLPMQKGGVGNITEHEAFKESPSCDDDLNWKELRSRKLDPPSKPNVPSDATFASKEWPNGDVPDLGIGKKAEAPKKKISMEDGDQEDDD